MKSINKKFTLHDFEKGLMLAGYLSPKNTSEVEERNILKEHDKANAKVKKEIYFKRAVLAAEIVNELKDEITFGRVKFQKMVYLCENIAHMKLSADRYRKFAAGPFDNKFMHSINREFKKQKWFDFEIVKDGNYSVPKYFELEKSNKYKEYYFRYFSEQDESIQTVISLFRKEKTRFAELIATLFFCWKEIVDENEKVTFELICEKFYTWAEEKKKFTRKEISTGIEWMKSQDLTPLSV